MAPGEAIQEATIPCNKEGFAIAVARVGQERILDNHEEIFGL